MLSILFDSGFYLATGSRKIDHNEFYIRIRASMLLYIKIELIIINYPKVKEFIFYTLVRCHLSYDDIADTANMFHMIKFAVRSGYILHVAGVVQALSCVASIVFAVWHLGNLGRRTFAVQVVSSTTLRYIKSPREKLRSLPSSRACQREGIRAGIQGGPGRAARSLIPRTMHRSAASRLDCTLKHSRNLVIASNLTYIYQ